MVKQETNRKQLKFNIYICSFDFKLHPLAKDFLSQDYCEDFYLAFVFEPISKRVLFVNFFAGLFNKEDTATAYLDACIPELLNAFSLTLYQNKPINLQIFLCDHLKNNNFINTSDRISFADPMTFSEENLSILKNLFHSYYDLLNFECEIYFDKLIDQPTFLYSSIHSSQIHFALLYKFHTIIDNEMTAYNKNKAHYFCKYNDFLE